MPVTVYLIGRVNRKTLALDVLVREGERASMSGPAFEVSLLSATESMPQHALEVLLHEAQLALPGAVPTIQTYMNTRYRYRFEVSPTSTT